MFFRPVTCFGQVKFTCSQHDSNSDSKLLFPKLASHFDAPLAL